MAGEKRRTEQTTIRIEVGLLAATREFAKSERRTVSGLIARALEWVMEEPAAFSAWEMGRRGVAPLPPFVMKLGADARELVAVEEGASEEEREAAAEMEAALLAGDERAWRALEQYQRWAADWDARQAAARTAEPERFCPHGHPLGECENCEYMRVMEIGRQKGD